MRFINIVERFICEIEQVIQVCELPMLSGISPLSPGFESIYLYSKSSEKGRKSKLSKEAIV